MLALFLFISSLCLVASFQKSKSSWSPYTKVATFLAAPVEFDPNFEAHLSKLLKVGQEDRPSPELASDLRKRYKQIGATKRKAAKALTKNPELAAELEELAAELEESSENFVNLATTWDAWNRPSPDLPRELRKQKDINAVDPNFEAHLAAMYLKGKNDQDRSSPNLPSELRMLKYKNMAKVQQLAAKTLREGDNKELAVEVSSNIYHHVDFFMITLTLSHSIVFYCIIVARGNC